MWSGKNNNATTHSKGYLRCWSYRWGAQSGCGSLLGAFVLSLSAHGVIIGGLWYFISPHQRAPASARELRIELSSGTTSAAVVSAPPPIEKSIRSRTSATPPPDRPLRKHAYVKGSPAHPAAAIDGEIVGSKPNVAPNSSDLDQGSQDQTPSIDMRVLDWLARFRTYPLAARRARIEGTVHLRALLMPDGSLIDARVEQSSGHPILDKAALDLLQRAARLPASFGSTTDQIELRLPIVYRMAPSAT